MEEFVSLKVLLFLRISLRKVFIGKLINLYNELVL